MTAPPFPRSAPPQGLSIAAGLVVYVLACAGAFACMWFWIQWRDRFGWHQRGQT